MPYGFAVVPHDKFSVYYVRWCGFRSCSVDIARPVSNMCGRFTASILAGCFLANLLRSWSYLICQVLFASGLCQWDRYGDSINDNSLANFQHKTPAIRSHLSTPDVWCVRFARINLSAYRREIFNGKLTIISTVAG